MEGLVDEGLKKLFTPARIRFSIIPKEKQNREELVRLQSSKHKQRKMSMSCSKECHRCIQFAVMTTERVDILEKNVERGFAGLEARLEGKTTPSGLDIAAVESRRRTSTPRHTSRCTPWVRKLDSEMVALKEKK